MATFMIDIFAVKCAVTIFSWRSMEYDFTGFDSLMIFHYYLLYLITAETAVITWIEYGLKQSKNELGWADFRVTHYPQIEK